jgi:hypothetical protein
MARASCVADRVLELIAWWNTSLCVARCGAATYAENAGDIVATA